jgi:adenylate cyclase class 2
MPVAIEREVKLRFESPDAARALVLAAGATSVRCRRLQEDCLLDTDGEHVRLERSVLRIRLESGKSLLTFKGPVQPSVMKVREELETVVGDGPVLLRICEALGFHVWFRYQKYREEFALDDVIVAIDETPIGTFVEIEGGEQGIISTTAALGLTPGDFLLDSYRGLFVRHCQEHGLPPTHMLFEDE